jgi:hypothetical protein
VDHGEVATRSPQAPVKGPTAIRIRGALSRAAEGERKRERERERDREREREREREGKSAKERERDRRRRASGLCSADSAGAREAEREREREREEGGLPARQPRELFLKIAFFLASPAAIMAHLKWQSCGRQRRRAIAASCATFGDPTLGPGSWTLPHDGEARGRYIGRIQHRGHPEAIPAAEALGPSEETIWPTGLSNRDTRPD